MEQATADPALRPKPQLTFDTLWWYDALRSHQLLIQRCTECGTLRHPVQPMCASCHCLSWDTVEASGQATVHSFVIAHHPKIPGFDYPLAIGLLDLEEGTRLLANIVVLENQMAVDLITTAKLGFAAENRCLVVM